MWLTIVITSIVVWDGYKYCQGICCILQGLIFVVDSNDRERAPEAREELSKMVCFIAFVFSSSKLCATMLFFWLANS